MNHKRREITYGQLIRRYLPRAQPDDCEFILWEMTPYPCWSPVEELKRLAVVCAPVRKPGWRVRLAAEHARQDADLRRACRDVASQEQTS